MIGAVLRRYPGVLAAALAGLLVEHRGPYGAIAADVLPGYVAAMAPAVGCGALEVTPPEPFTPR
ncbi:hypothetical protein [Streptomyces radicis]|uniref:Uncharacterized protein n=1 Tax=Streptomyces radicis TaxID=1750517 RepID=A0A3A9WGM9_9ACTN|nr:hypothetical protein [Streptomyces radicis]RKN12105.1 hypothetical protein D7319_04265 [Streptomyces radicis]RKN25842.1 hypothetical protein D7318_06215 [Streptomyces radicis]